MTTDTPITTRVKVALERLRLERAIEAARERAAQHPPFSPAWDAAIGQIEDLERELLSTESQSDGVRV
jgi:hypothetical protein